MSTRYVPRNVRFAIFGRLDDFARSIRAHRVRTLLTFTPEYNADGIPSCIAHRLSEIRIPPVESMDSMPGPEDSERGTEIANRATEKGETYEKAVAGIEVAD